MMLNKIIFAL